MKIINKYSEYIKKNTMFIALVLIALFFQIMTNGVLLKPLNITNLILQNSYILILAIGMLPVILTGNIDLSVGSLLGLIGAITGTLIISKGYSISITVIIALIIGGLIGAWNGFWVAYIKIPSFIATLAGMLIFRGLSMLVLKGNTLSPFPDSYQIVSSGYIKELFPYSINLTTLLLGIIISIAYIIYEIYNTKKMTELKLEINKKNLIFKIIFVIFLINLSTFWLSLSKGFPIVLILLSILVFIYSFITKKMVLGRHIYALGGNEKATELSGINTKKVLFLTYINMGVMAALAGFIYSGRLNAATPAAGNGFELDAIAACYIGGASASGGVGSILGAIIGGLVMGILNNGMSILGIGIDYQQTIKGLVLLAAVVLDIYNRKKL